MSLRDLIRWCDRIVRVKTGTDENNKEEEQYYMDAIDCFCNSIPKASARKNLG